MSTATTRDTAGTPPSATPASTTPTMVWPVLTFRDARTAIAFLVEAFGFEEVAVYARDDDPSIVEPVELRHLQRRVTPSCVVP